MTRSFGSFSNWGGWASFGPLGGRRRFFESGQVRLAVLSLLKEGPKHGYEVIKQFEVRSGGLYRASAGTVYPTLQLLEDEGLIVSETVAGKRVYRITSEGLLELERESETVDEIWGRAERWEEWSRCMGPQAFAVAGPVGHLVKAALLAAQAAGDSADRQQRIREILDHARQELTKAAKSSGKD
jgi:DNA-binding PadR family transcriptional regulator